uniref:SCP domain-containing protein n=1 Tax=Rhodnius prolixus TaxID=13249 RepID=T1H9G2_RHOPR
MKACIAIISGKSERPKIYGPRLSPRMLHLSYRRVQRQILYLHNAFRSQVKPPASDMLAMKWDTEASKAAQRLAQQCRQLDHERHWDKKLGFCGQNIFISTQQVPWLFAVRTWYLEKNKYKYGMRNNSLKETGHYLQMVWATSHKLGCGFATCPGSVRGAKYFSYVCNYCPTGNYLGKLGRPYKKGIPCSSCAQHCRKGKLCTNNCDGVDLWFNCREIHRTWPQWLCESDGAKGLERKQNCAATCNCKGKIT